MEQIVDFQEKCICPSRAQANKGGEVTLMLDIPQALCLKVIRVSSYAFFTRATEKFKIFYISANNLNKYTLKHTQK